MATKKTKTKKASTTRTRIRKFPPTIFVFLEPDGDDTVSVAIYQLVDVKRKD